MGFLGVVLQFMGLIDLLEAAVICRLSSSLIRLVTTQHILLRVPRHIRVDPVRTSAIQHYFGHLMLSGSEDWSSRTLLLMLSGSRASRAEPSRGGQM